MNIELVDENGKVIYKGGWKDDKREGKGSEYENDKYYAGDWKDDKREGKGVLWYNNFEKIYEGDWKNGKRHGLGTEYFNDKIVYDGDWKNGKRHGDGRLFLYFKDGIIYTYQNKILYDESKYVVEKDGFVFPLYCDCEFLEGKAGCKSIIFDLDDDVFLNNIEFKDDFLYVWNSPKKRKSGRKKRRPNFAR